MQSMPIRWFAAGLLPCGFATCLVLLRSTVGPGWPWMLVNIGLVVVPLCFAAATTRRRWWMAIPWLAFFPNAPYVVSDIIHYAPRPPLPDWYDAALLGSLAAGGLFAGSISAVWVVRCVTHRLPGAVGALAWVPLGLAAGRAIELGRVHRFNSWDLVLQPATVGQQLVAPLLAPAAHADAWGITVVYAGLVVAWGLSLELLVSRPARTGPTPEPACL